MRGVLMFIEHNLGVAWRGPDHRPYMRRPVL